jgi:Holliday junction resolvasome RuvABC endonuclease subunit
VTFFIGIDPGFLGACGIVDNRGRAQVFDAPILVTTSKPRKGKVKTKREYDLQEIARMINRFSSDSFAFFEKVGARPDQGVSSMWSMGYGSGIWEMALTFAKIPYTRVSPLKWKNAMLEGVGHDKEASILRAQQLFPHVDLSTNRGAMRDGRAEALLLAEFGRREFKQGKL